MKLCYVKFQNPIKSLNNGIIYFFVYFISVFKKDNALSQKNILTKNHLSS